MYSDKVKKKTLLIFLIVLAVICVLLAAWAYHTGQESIRNGGSAALQSAVLKSARQCYVVEGVYPSDLAYLEENYGLQVNKDGFYVTYDAFAENLPPDVRVTVRK